MLTIYKTTQNGLDRIERPVNGGWINAIDPTPEETIQLEELGIEHDLITYSLDMDEMARMERDEDYMLV